MVMEQHDITEWPFSFTHFVPLEEVDNRVRVLAAAQGVRPKAHLGSV
jgi:hypothetical protein